MHILIHKHTHTHSLTHSHSYTHTDDDSISSLPSKVAAYILAYIDKMRNLKGALSPRSQVSYLGRYRENSAHIATVSVGTVHNATTL